MRRRARVALLLVCLLSTAASDSTDWPITQYSDPQPIDDFRYRPPCVQLYDLDWWMAGCFWI